MLKINIVTLFPGMFEEFLSHGLLGSAIKKQKLEVNLINPRDFTEDIHKTVDDKPFGGGDGMLMLSAPLEKLLGSLGDSGKVLALSPQGKLWDYKQAKKFSAADEITLICGRYAGMDQRFINEYVDQEVSVGDYVLNGGEVGAFVLLESISRFIPGFMGNENSPAQDSFEEQGLLEAPQFTRPRVCLEQEVPEVLMSGHHKKIQEWKKSLSLVVTQLKRPELIVKNKIDKNKLKEAFEFVLQMPDLQIKSCGFEKSNLIKERDQIG